MPREACCRHVLYRVVESMADLPSQGSLEIGAELRWLETGSTHAFIIFVVRGTNVWATRRVLMCNKVQARRPVAGIRAHDNSEVWSRANAVPLLQWANNGSRHLAGVSGGAKGADFFWQLSSKPRHNSNFNNFVLCLGG